MYINPFVCGVASTLLIELVALVVYGIYLNKKGK